MSEEQQPFRDAQDKLGDRIIEHFGGQPDPVERDKLIGAIELGQDIASYLMSEKADDDTWVDTGSDGSGYECFVTIKGREYQVYVSPRSTDAEMDAWESALGKSEDEVEDLERRVLAALRIAGNTDLATEFEALISVSNIGRDRDAEHEARELDKLVPRLLEILRESGDQIAFLQFCAHLRCNPDGSPIEPE